MEKKSNNSNNLLKAILLACIATAVIFAIGNRYAYKDDSVVNKEDSVQLIDSTAVISNDFVDSTAEAVIRDDASDAAGITVLPESASIEDEFINNTLETGATPYAKYYGKNKKCASYGCSQIKVHTSNSDVLVTIKKDGTVVRHAYIKGGDSFTFSFPNGTYQAFFYYGRGWNPDKEMKGGQIKGGFVADESFGKDDPQTLSNNILEYSLILQQNGNFSTRPSDSDEAL